MERGRSRSKATVASEVWGIILGVAMAQRDRFMGVMQEFDLTPGDFRALASLDEDTPRPMGALAQSWQCDASNATWMVDRLEQRGLVERRGVPADRRVKAVALTAKGVETRGRVFRRLHEPPPEFLALDRATLLQLRDACVQLPPAVRSQNSAGPQLQQSHLPAD
jgi:DNA-binding MarR family transcriptional regulator